jgi:hypothetical protein
MFAKINTAKLNPEQLEAFSKLPDGCMISLFNRVPDFIKQFPKYYYPDKYEQIQLKNEGREYRSNFPGYASHLRMKFILTAKKYIGVPYHQKYLMPH